MDHFEMTERLSEKAQVSYEEAKAALELNDWDMLEAIVYLEREGKAKRSEHSYEKTEAKAEKKPEEKKEQVVGNLFETAANLIVKLVEKGNRNRLEIYRESRLLVKVPLTVAAVLAIIACWAVVPALVIGWLAGCRYRLAGQDIDKKNSTGEVV